MNKYRQTAQNYRITARMTKENAKETLEQLAEQITKDAKDKLQENGSIRTGRLYDSIRHEEEEKDGVFTAYVIADAENPDTGQEYAEFVEYGTGIYNEHGDGRTTPWKYKFTDEEGNEHWITTRGYQAKPFMRPALVKNTEKFINGCRDIITEAFEEIISFKADQ